jgi:hypothetical protein
LRACLTDNPPLTIAAIACLLVSTRMTSLMVLAALLAGYCRWIGAEQAPKTGMQWPLAALQEAWPVVAGAIVSLALQLSYNPYAAGEFVYASYRGEYFHFVRQMQLAVLLSSERGLYTYYPVVALVLVLAFTIRRTRWATPWVTGIIMA